jgi:hypothetical protein
MKDPMRRSIALMLMARFTALPPPSLILLPALLLALLVLTAGPGQAVPKKTADQCTNDEIYCLSACGDKTEACRKGGWGGCEAGRIVCANNCNMAKKDCIKDAGKNAGKTKTQPLTPQKVTKSPTSAPTQPLIPQKVTKSPKSAPTQPLTSSPTLRQRNR